MSIFTISNFTRYNTENLERMFDYVEGKVVNLGSKNIPPGGVPYSPEPNKWRTPKDSLFIAIKEYNPNTIGPPYSYMKGHTYSSESDFGILSPSKLISSPIEEIAAIHTRPLFPRQGCVELASRIWHRYDTTGLTVEPKWNDLPDLPSIKIEEQPNKKVDVVERHRVARKLSDNSLSVSFDFLKRLRNHYADMSQSVGSGLKHLTKAKIELSPTELELQEKVAALKHHIESISNILIELTEKD